MSKWIDVPNGLANIRIQITDMGGQDDEHTLDYYSATYEFVGLEGQVVSISRGLIFSLWGTRVSIKHAGKNWEPIVYVGYSSELPRSYLGGKETRGSINALVNWYEEQFNTSLRADFIRIKDGKIQIS